MLCNNLRMQSKEFSFRPLLGELTEVVNTRGLDPYEAYGWLYESQIKLGLKSESYLSTSITSGGHARDNSLDFKEIIIRNTESAKILAEQLAVDGQIRPENAIEPVFVGKTHWNQAEFMEFWLSVIGGLDLTSNFIARDINNLRDKTHESFEKNNIDLDKMISKLDAESRALEYFKMSNAFADLIKNGMDATPISTIVRMIDTETSLGAQTERTFGRQIGSRVMNITVVQPTQPEKLESVNHILAKDTARLISFGATVFDTSSSEVMLILTESAA